MHDGGRLRSTKLPAASETPVPVHPVVPPLPSLPSIVTVTPAIDVSSGSSTTVRPRKVVVGTTTLTCAPAVWDAGIPSTVADAVTVNAAWPTDCPGGAVNVRT